MESRSDRIPSLVADDWGLSREINDAIIDLCQLGALKRVSVMVDEPFFEYRLNELLGAINETSLHLSLSHWPIYKLWDFLSPSSINQLEEEIIRQILLYTSKGFVDLKIESHRYVHYCPAVARALSNIFRQRNFESWGTRFTSSWNRPLLAMASDIIYALFYRDRTYRLDSVDFNPYSKWDGKLATECIYTVVHPAREISKDLSDPWRERRKLEYDLILRSFTLKN
jgi:predicted glycoside hydrolase/deacetylase ChbG (UPF0249 family)